VSFDYLVMLGMSSEIFGKQCCMEGYGRIWRDMVWIRDEVTSKLDMDTDTIAVFL
jgi:hypothetical protein